MAQTSTVRPISQAPGVGLAVWMRRVSDRVDKARVHVDRDSVHALRTALRRCRAMADALSEVNPDPVWGKVGKASRKLFKTLGSLRDAQIEREWLKKLSTPREPVGARFLGQLSGRQKELTKEVSTALAEFDSKAWKRMVRKVESRSGLFPAGSIVFRRLALARLERFALALGKAQTSGGAVTWHRSRIGLKHFRYVGENFLPQKFAPLSNGVKQLQDLLGEAHDLDILRADLEGHSAEFEPRPLARLIDRIQLERKARLRQASLSVTGEASLLVKLREAFEISHVLRFESQLDRRTA